MRALRASLGLVLGLSTACALDETGAADTADASLGGGAAGEGGGGGGGAGVGGSAGSDASVEEAGGGSSGFTTALHQTRVELPCLGAEPPACSATSDTETVVFEGTPGVVYNVTLRFRGVVELNTYLGGSQDGLFHVGGEPENNGWGVFSVSVTDPPASFHLNSDQAGTLHCFAIDYSRTIQIAGGATVTLYANSADGKQVQNFDDKGAPIVIPGVPPDPAPFDGQFIQVDVVSMSR